MAGSTFGTIFKITTWGESHGKALGVVVDGCPAGLVLSEATIQKFLDRRKPGQSSATTPRKEADKVEILSGVFQGKTTGTPISLMIRNTSQISTDYSEIQSCYRPGHADYTYDAKYGFRDYQGGGRSSGRETAGRVAAGAIAAEILHQLGIYVFAYTRSIGPIEVNADCKNIGDSSSINREYIRKISLSTQTAMPDREADQKALAFLEDAKKQKDSVGGCIECVVQGCPPGIGDPVFEKLDANLAKAIMSIGAVKAVEIGDGCKASYVAGNQNNDSFCIKDGHISKATNHAGGILGGISDGSAIIIRAYIKPTPSISQPQQTVTADMEETTIQIKGRHDPVIAPRAVVVVESMTALTLLDALLMNMGSRLDSILKFYGK